MYWIPLTKEQAEDLLFFIKLELQRPIPKDYRKRLEDLQTVLKLEMQGKR